MKYFVFFFLFCTSVTSLAENSIIESTTQPSVSNRAMVCTQWRRYNTGAGSLIWGCLNQPQEVVYAEGAATDAVIQSLQSQIDQLKIRLDALEKP